MGSRVATLELEPGRDYHVLRGYAYERHEESHCSQCQDHAASYDPDWPKLHEVNQVLRGAPLEVYLTPTPEVFVLPQALMPARSRSNEMGNIFGDIFDFIKSIIDSILNFIGQLLARILHDLLHPMDLLKDLVQVVVDTMTGAAFLKLMNAFPLTHWLYQGLNWLTGGFMDNLTLTLSLPGMLLTGQPITRAMLMKALSVAIVAIGFALTFVTGGMVLAIIGLAVNLLKQGPIGKTALGRTILDIAGIGLGAVCGGGDLISAFVSAGMGKLKGTAIGELANKLHLSGAIVGLAVMGAGAAAGAANSDDDEDLDTSDGSDATSSDEDFEPTEASDEPNAAMDTEGTDAPSSPENDIDASQEDPGTEPGTDDSEFDDESDTDDTSSDEESTDSGDIPSDTESGESDVASNDEEGDASASDDEDQSSDSEEGDEESADSEDDEESDDEDEEESDDEEDSSSIVDALKAAQILAVTANSLLTPHSASHPAPATHAVSSTQLKKPASASSLKTAHAIRAKVGMPVLTAAQKAAQQKTFLMVAGVGAIAILALMNDKRRS